MKKNIIVTGAYGAIGKAICRQLARHGHSVTMVGRDENKLQKAMDEIITATCNQLLSIAVVDLSLQADMRRFAESWDKPLHILVNNSGIVPLNRKETAENIEMQFATNVLGYFWMTRFLTPALTKAAPARVINVASYYAGGLNMEDLEFRERKYEGNAAYRQSKQANRMLTVAFAEKLNPLGITVNSCHPGDVNSKLSNDLGFRGSMSPEEGAATPVWLATDKSLDLITGKYFAHSHEVTCEFSKDKAAIDRLYEFCEKMTGSNSEGQVIGS